MPQSPPRVWRWRTLPTLACEGAAGVEGGAGIPLCAAGDWPSRQATGDNGKCRARRTSASAGSRACCSAGSGRPRPRVRGVHARLRGNGGRERERERGRGRHSGGSGVRSLTAYLRCSSPVTTAAMVASEPVPRWWNGDKERERAANLQESAELGDGLIGADDAWPRRPLPRRWASRRRGRGSCRSRRRGTARRAFNGGDARVGAQRRKRRMGECRAPRARRAGRGSARPRIGGGWRRRGGREAPSREKDIGEFQQAARAAETVGVRHGRSRAPRAKPRWKARQGRV